MPVTRYPDADEATNVHSTPAQKMAAILGALEIADLSELGANAAETWRRTIVILDDKRLTHILAAIEAAKAA